MNPDLVNLYIERLLTEVGELTKTRLLLDTQLKFTEMLNVQLQTKINELETNVEKLNNRKSKTEVNTSDEQF